MNPSETPSSGPRVGILVLNYRHPDQTLACVRSLLAREGPDSRILWIENDAASTGDRAERTLAAGGVPWTRLDPAQDPLPGPGVVGLLANAENLGYAGGNNVGLRFLRARGVPFAWILNNDTELLRGNSADLLARAAAEPAVGAWGTAIQQGERILLSHRLSRSSFAAIEGTEPGDLELPESFLTGSSLFLRLEAAAQVGDLPESYFLYYEDVAFSIELRRAGWKLGLAAEVRVHHLESATAGRRSARVEYSTRRNRLHLLRRYFPEALESRRRDLLYATQKYLFRGEWTKLRMEWAAHRDFRRGIEGRRPDLS